MEDEMDGIPKENGQISEAKLFSEKQVMIQIINQHIFLDLHEVVFLAE